MVLVFAVLPASLIVIPVWLIVVPSFRFLFDEDRRFELDHGEEPYAVAALHDRREAHA
jgi:hypothetical protein